MNKKTKQMLKEWIDLGWYVARATNHLIWRHPDGGVVTTGKTVSDHRAFKNADRYFKAESLKYGIIA